MTRGVGKVASHMIACVAAGTNHKTATSLGAGLLVQVVCSYGTVLQFEFIVGHPSLCGGKFHFYCGTAVSSVCVT